MPRSLHNEIAAANPSHPAKPSWPTRTHPRQTRAGLETIRYRIKKGFRGWHQRGYLPHFDAPDVTQFVTFQLHDSFPVTRRPEFEAILKESDDSVKRKKLEASLDRGHGECWLRQPDVAKLVEMILLEADGRDYRMQAWVVMPNHVHLVVDVGDVPLVN